jgi:hypothetical protein
MKYSFEKKLISQSKVYLIESEDTPLLGNFGLFNWTPEKAQEIIDGVENAKTDGIRYEWANEDVHLLALKDRIFFYDLLAMRGGSTKSEQDLDMGHAEFITFMKDFKKFIEENS